MVWHWRDDSEGVVYACASTVFIWSALCMRPITKVFKGKRQRKTKKNIVGAEEYVRPTLYAIGGIGMNANLPVNKAITVVLGNIVIKLR